MVNTLGLLERLPRELRDKIYALCLTSSLPVVLHKSINTTPSAGGSTPTSTSFVTGLPTLAATSKAINHELHSACDLSLHHIAIWLAKDRDRPSFAFKNAAKVEKLLIRVLLEPHDLIIDNTRGRSRCGDLLFRLIKNNFPNVKEVAVEMGMSDTTDGISGFYELDAFVRVQDGLVNVPNLCKFSILFVPNMIGLYVNKESQGWICRSRGGEPVLSLPGGPPPQGKPSLSGKPMTNDAEWLCFLEGMGAATIWKAYFAKLEEISEGTSKVPMSDAWVDVVTEYWQAKALLHGVALEYTNPLNAPNL